MVSARSSRASRTFVAVVGTAVVCCVALAVPAVVASDGSSAATSPHAAGAATTPGASSFDRTLDAPAVVSAPDPDDARLTVTDVTVSPATPTVEDPITFEVRLRNSVGSLSAVTLDRVIVREVRPGENRTVAAASNLGTLSPGDGLTVPVTGRFSAPGARQLVVIAVGTDKAGNQTRVRRPLSIVVRRAPPRLDVRVGELVAGTSATVSVAVSNPTETTVRDVRLNVDGDGVTAVGDRRTIPDLAPGERVVIELPIRATRPGTADLRVTATYASGSGVLAETERTTTVQVAPADRDVGVRVEPTVQEESDDPLGGAVSGVLGGRSTEQQDDDERRPQVTVTVTNFGNVPARDVVVTPRIEDRKLPRRTVPDLAPGASASVTVDLSTVDRPGTIEVTVDYRAAGESDDAVTTYQYRPATGSVQLTGVDLVFEDGQLRITGNAGNTGEATVRGVVVSVGESATVSPAYPRRSYFVGTVEGSEFAPFELTADVDSENVSTIPVRVRYVVDGVEYERTVAVEYDDSLQPNEGDDGPPLWLYGGGVAGLLAVVILFAVVLRRSGRL